MKTALCFAGTGRSIEYTFDNLKSHLIEDLKDTADGCDVFVYIADNPKAKMTEDYFSEYSWNIDVVKEQPTNPSEYTFESNWPPSTPNNLEKGRDIYLKMLKSRKHLMNMVDSIGKYDRVIFSRMDVIYETKITETLHGVDINYLWLPSFHHWNGGYNDRFAVSNQYLMRVYMSQSDHMEKYRDDGFIFQAERTLKHHLDTNGVVPKILKCNFIRIRDGKQHETFKSIQVETKTCDI